jgi:hypothetical protein
MVERLAFGVLPAIAFLVVGALTFANTSDDPLITLRYAYNLLHHGQPVFNLGERVEGYTSPLHLLIATGVLLLPGGFELLKLKLISVAFAAGALWQTERLARVAGLPRWGRLATLVAVAGSWNFVVSASNGLETSLVAFLAIGTAVSLARGEDWRRTAVWAGLLGLTRPDAVLVIVLLAAVSLRRGPSSSWWRRVLWLSGPGVTVGALEAFRIAYYGALVPNTYFAKQFGLLPGLGRGLLYLLYSEPLGAWGIRLVVIALEGWLISVAARRFGRSRPAMAYAMAVVVAEILFVLSSGGDWMKGGRFLAPAIPAVTVLTFCGVEALVSEARAKWVRALVVAGVVALLVAPVDTSYFAPVWRLEAGVGDGALIAHGHYPLSPVWVGAVGLADCLKPADTVAWSEVGLFGYERLDLRVIDTRGLTDREIATRAPAADKHPWGVTDPDWYRATSTVGRILLRRRPDMIISIDDSATSRPGAEIFGGLYRRLALIPEPKPDHTMLTYVRRGVACTEPLPSSS